MAGTGTLILQLHAEHPEWSRRRIAEEVRRRDPTAKTTARSVSSTLSHSRNSAPWPPWPQPSGRVLASMARSMTPFVRFLHPDVVATVADDNQRRRRDWWPRLAALGIDPIAYLWDGSPCAFPGIRRGAGREQKRAPGFLDPDGNEYPKHVWAFALTGDRFRKQGPTGYHLAHLFDHKAHGNRWPDELVAAGTHADPQELHGLFTSAANCVFVPAAFAGFTDFSSGFRRLLQRKAEQLYGDRCRLVPPTWAIKADYDPMWTPDHFNWGSCEGTNARIDRFLEFRWRCIDRLIGRYFQHGI